LHQEEVTLAVGGEAIAADLVLPANVGGIVVFAHGSGSSRKSARNRLVAHALHDLGFGTLLLDLLTATEERVDMATGELRFDVLLLAERLTLATGWLAEEPRTSSLPLGYFGASTGAAAALVAAAEYGARVRAVVSRGGRPDLAGEALARVAAPTLLIVGERDPIVLDLNRQALDELSCEKELVVVPGATHLFEEPGALERVAELAGRWFRRWLR
jgi:pimeloyl-ACP methyl ester carboxylesterase